MSLIAGYEQFSSEFLSLQRQVARRMRTLQAFAHQSHHLLPNNQLEKLASSWSMIEQGWQRDSVMENFEFHSHFIEQLLQIMMLLARRMERPVADEFVGIDSASPEKTNAGLSARKQAFSQVGLLVFVCNQLPSLIEQVAKIRGLSTLAASRGSVDELELGKLKYFIQGTRVQYEKVRNQADRLGENTDNRIPALPLIKAYEFKLMFLLTTVEKEVMEPRAIRMDSSQLFSLATEIIDAYLKVVDEGLTLLYLWQEESLDLWHKHGDQV
ncbi:hypothetical protein GCM10007877_12590 [Marinibactrum halimedae]|uniref:Uncharacterized protein n=2 Tax=Marinibactrum halimedae TaxID=1444977 RepID=A0AA37T1U9_9GAMM|nr:hypothetical protein GCM10007877_12590 [Marinibactrum halimedae]